MGFGCLIRIWWIWVGFGSIVSRYRLEEYVGDSWDLERREDG